MKRLFNKVAIVGTGLIGGSIALAIKRKRLAKAVVGISRHRQSLILAKKIGAIDSGSQELDIVKGSDLLILATPVNAIMKLAPAISGIIGKECIVSDVGSTKKEIVSSLERLFPNYLGSHPLAGSEKRSIKNAHPYIFKDSLCILTPTKNTNSRVLYLIKRLWAKLGARTVVLDPESHDKILSFVSHLPHAVAFSLMNTIPPDYFRFASTGLRDTTRIAASDSQLWADILLSNRRNLKKAIELLQRNLSSIKSAIQKEDRERLFAILKAAKKKRESLDSEN